MAVKYLFAGFCRTHFRVMLCAVVMCLFSNYELYAQESSAYTEKHIYDSSENFFNRKEKADEAYGSYPLKDKKDADRALIELKKDKAFWYVGEIEKFQGRKMIYRRMLDSLAKMKQPLPDDEQLLDDENSTQSLVSIILWILIIGILAFALIYFLAANKLSLFAKRDIVSQTTGDSDGPAINIFESPFAAMLLKAESERNFRLMTRILYLQTLRLLSDRNIIKYNPAYTNLEYLHQLRATDHYADFFTITRHYEYVWYGKFELTEPVYRQVEIAIRSFQNKIG
ncbi:MAG: DUF4129 domain-containing protein [Bacteroidota bacterium]